MIEKLYLYGTHPDSYHPYEPAEIIGLKMYTPLGLSKRPCVEVQYGDGFVNWVPLIKIGFTHELTTLPELGEYMRRFTTG